MPANGSAVDVVAAVSTLSIGDSVASIDELLAGASNDHASEETSSLASQPEPAVGAAPETPTGPDDTAIIDLDEPTPSSTAPMAIAPQPVENGQSTAASMAQTPRNDVFLSTLAIPPSQQINGHASGDSSALTSGANSSRISSEIAEEPEVEAAEEAAFVLES